jgi:hypothetical protein
VTRLINFGLGEVCDRLSILALKILYGEEKKLDVAHFKHERVALLPKLIARDNGRWLEHYSDLAAVNAALWHCEDHIRGRREAIAKEKDEGVVAEHRHAAGVLGLQIATLNDRRAALIQQINEFVGDKVQEKV